MKKSTRFAGSSSAAPRHDDEPLSRPSHSSKSSRKVKGSMVKRAFKSIFSMCKRIITETNENHHDIIEIKSHLGLPTDTYHELPEFDDLFAE